MGRGECLVCSRPARLPLTGRSRRALHRQPPGHGALVQARPKAHTLCFAAASGSSINHVIPVSLQRTPRRHTAGVPLRNHRADVGPRWMMHCMAFMTRCWKKPAAAYQLVCPTLRKYSRGGGGQSMPRLGATMMLGTLQVALSSGAHLLQTMCIRRPP